MKEQTGKGILVAIDGSDYAFHTVHYISRIPSFKEIEIHLFTVLTTIPGPCLDLQREPVFRGKAAEILAWESRQRQECYWYMERAKQVLLNAGFSPRSVSTELHEMERGVARDIIKESGKGYAALVAGKRGPGGVKQLVLGGIATKLLQKVSSVSLFLIGRNPRPGKFLVAFDGSEGAMRAVDCVAGMLGGSGSDINLTNVIRFWEDEKGLIAEAEKMVVDAFDRAVERLTNAGIPRTRISTQIITGAQSRAGAIVEEALKTGCGTIVVGRRGFSQVKDFSMGRVANKVVQIARGHAVWVVN